METELCGQSRVTATIAMYRHDCEMKTLLKVEETTNNISLRFIYY